MNRKKRLILLIPIILLIGAIYWFGFYKTYYPNQIHKDATVVIVLDKKEIAKTVIWQKLKSFDFEFSPSIKDDGFDWLDAGIKIPDYVCLFKLSNDNSFYFVSMVSNEKDFEKSLKHFGVIGKENKDFSTFYEFDSLKLNILRIEDRLLISNQKSEQKLKQIAEDLFNYNKVFDSSKINETLTKTKHASCWIKQNQFLNNDAFVNLSIQENQIKFEGNHFLSKEYFLAQEFDFEKNSLVNFGSVFSQKFLSKLNENQKNTISKKLGFSLDSLIQSEPKYLSLNLTEFKPKIIKTIKYDFDEDFNEIEVEAIDSTYEPDFQINLSMKQPKRFYDYLKSQKLIDSSNVFVQIPFAKTFISFNENELVFNTEGFKSKEQFKTKPRVFNLHLNKMDSVALSQLPISKRVSKIISKIDSVELSYDSNGLNSVLYFEKDFFKSIQNGIKKSVPN